MSSALETLLARFDPTLPLERARTIPAAWYHDHELAAAERQRVFGNAWLLAGRADQVGDPGSFFTVDLAGEPIVVARDEEGTLRAFHNVCRHRGARVACEEEGRATRLRCRYHGWTYDLAGRLRGTPEFDGVQEFRREDNGLPPVAADVAGPLVWVHAGPHPTPLAEWVGPLQRRGSLAVLAGFRWHSRREYRLACNWKVFVDNYLDGGYHVNTVHPGLAGVIDYKSYRTEIDEHTSVQISPLRPGRDEDEVAQVRSGGSAYYWWIFPNLMINLYEKALDTNLVLPDGPDACRVIFDFFFRDSDTCFIEQSLTVAHQIQLEDADICEEVQRGLHSRSYDTGRFSVRREPAGYHFHQLLARWLADHKPDAPARDGPLAGASGL
jgi:choline monooxygenase